MQSVYNGSSSDWDQVSCSHMQSIHRHLVMLHNRGKQKHEVHKISHCPALTYAQRQGYNEDSSINTRDIYSLSVMLQIDSLTYCSLSAKRRIVFDRDFRLGAMDDLLIQG